MSTFDETFELWSLEKDKRMLALPLTSSSLLQATARGCVAHVRQQQRGYVAVVANGQVINQVATDGQLTALAAKDGQIFFAVRDEVHIVTPTKQAAKRQKLRLRNGITALVGINSTQLAVGFGNGQIEIHDWASPEAPMVRLERTPAGAVRRMLLGPSATLAVGFDSGAVGLWLMSNAKRLALEQLHGPVVHLLLSEQSLFAATSLGQHLHWSLQSLHASRCCLLENIWRSVPSEWVGGRAVARPTPPRHACLAANACR